MVVWIFSFSQELQQPMLFFRDWVTIRVTLSLCGIRYCP